MSESLGAMLVQLRGRKGYTQLHVAEALCAASGETTVTRHEVSRWERQERIPSAFWLRWLATVLEVPMPELEAAAAATRKQPRAPTPVVRSPAAALSKRGTKALPGTGTAQRSAPVASIAPPSRRRDDPVSRVSIKFEHQTTSVRLSGTYGDPRQALSAIGAFRSMVGDEPAGPTAAAPDVHDGVSEAPRRAIPGSQHRPSVPATAALTAAMSPEVPMGIRYTKRPIEAPSDNGRRPA